MRPEEIITLNGYQIEAQRTRKGEYGPIPAIIIDALGLAGEAGEFADGIKKVFAQGHDIDKPKLVKELGDILWYLTDACTSLGVTLEYVAQMNAVKLQGRYPNGFDPERSKNRSQGDV